MRQRLFCPLTCNSLAGLVVSGVSHSEIAMTALSPQVQAAKRDRETGRMTLRRFFVENGLSVVLMVLFLVFWFLQTITGYHSYNEDQREHGEDPITLVEYLKSGHFVEATSENWESEFLQMAAFVWLTSFLFQKGSPESNDPYEKEEVPPVTEKSPWPARRGGWILKLYANSLSLAFLLIFLISWIIHGISGARLYSEEQSAHGLGPLSFLQYIRLSRFWFESFQNWQSEFLAIFLMVLLAVFLRQKNSPESKPVETPHSENE